MSKPARYYYTTDRNGRKQKHWLVGAHADGTEVFPDAHYETIKANAATRELKRLEAKREGTKLDSASLPQAELVFCMHEICKARKHLTNTPAADGSKYVHQDPSIPETRLRFVHYGHDSKYPAHPDCPDYYNPKKKEEDIYANLKESDRQEIRARVLEVLHKPDVLRASDAKLGMLFGDPPQEFMTTLRKKSESALAENAMLIAHPELFPYLAAVRKGYHPHRFRSSGNTHTVIYKPSEETQPVSYPNPDGSIHTRQVAKKIQLWFKQGFRGRPPGMVTGWEFDVIVNGKPPAPAAVSSPAPSGPGAPQKAEAKIETSGSNPAAKDKPAIVQPGTSLPLDFTQPLPPPTTMAAAEPPPAWQLTPSKPRQRTHRSTNTTGKRERTSTRPKEQPSVKQISIFSV